MEASLAISPFFDKPYATRAEVLAVTFFLIKQIQGTIRMSQDNNLICGNLLEFCPRATRSSLEDFYQDEHLKGVVDQIRMIVGTEKYKQTVFPILSELFYLWIWHREEQEKRAPKEPQPQPRKSKRAQRRRNYWRRRRYNKSTKNVQTEAF